MSCARNARTNTRCVMTIISTHAIACTVSIMIANVTGMSTWTPMVASVDGMTIITVRMAPVMTLNDISLAHCWRGDGEMSSDTRATATANAEAHTATVNGNNAVMDGPMLSRKYHVTGISILHDGE